jgi:hypothetical protein
MEPTRCSMLDVEIVSGNRMWKLYVEIVRIVVWEKGV